MLPAVYQNHTLSDSIYWLSQITEKTLGIQLGTTGGGEHSCFMEADSWCEHSTAVDYTNMSVEQKCKFGSSTTVPRLLPSLSGCFDVRSLFFSFFFTAAMLASFKADILCLSLLQRMKDMPVRGTHNIGSTERVEEGSCFPMSVARM